MLESASRTRHSKHEPSERRKDKMPEKRKTTRRTMLKRAGALAAAAAGVAAASESEAQVRRRADMGRTAQPAGEVAPQQPVATTPASIQAQARSGQPAGSRLMQPAEFQTFFNDLFDASSTARRANMTPRQILQKNNLSVDLPPAAARRLAPLLDRSATIGGIIAEACGACSACGACGLCDLTTYASLVAAIASSHSSFPGAASRERPAVR
jgi:hypothetical protein